MKVLFLALFIPFSFFFSGENVQPESNDIASIEYTSKKVEVEVEVEVDFGRKKKGCSGFGVCKISGSAGIKGILDGNRGIASISVKSNHATAMTFLKESMTKATIKKYFSGRNFIMEEDFKTKVTGKNGTYDFLLPAGNYKINKTAKGFNIGMPPN